MYSFHVNSFEQWRDTARALINAGISPTAVNWQTGQQDGLFGSTQLSDIHTHCQGSNNKPLAVPSTFLSQAKQAACFVDAAQPARKWAVLYSLLWRLTQVDKRTLSLKSDREVQSLSRMCKAVGRDKHKMTAFVRFQKVGGDAMALQADNLRQTKDEYYMAWFEPAHVIIESIAPFFVKRFTGMNWSILTPYGCAHWNQSELKLSPGVSKPDIEEDQFDEFWRTYYRSIFNPARLKEQAMRSEMPKKYWKYLPEASCIKELSRGAAASMEKMVNDEVTNSERIRSRYKSVVARQDKLRANNQR